MTSRIVRRIARPVRPTHIDALESRVLFATIVGLTSTDQIVTFDSATPGTASAPVNITGLASDTLVGIDFRPASGVLFGLGASGQLYTINNAGAATAVGAPVAVTGTNFGFDFNPQVDRIRVVSDADTNFRLVPGTGAIAGTDTALAYEASDANAGADPNVTAVAYNSNTASTGTTTLFGIDTALDVLVTQGSVGGTPTSPNSGQLFTVGALGQNVTDVGGFDVAESDGVAYAAFVPNGGTASTFYTLDLTTGAATAAAAAIGTNLTLKGLSAVPATQRLFALASSGTAFTAFNLGDVSATTNTSTNITGLASGDTLASIDFRPATGQLFGATADGQVYTIDPATGAATAVGTGFTPALAGTISDIDFNPTVDRIRVVTSADANARANPDTGVLVDSNTTTDGVQVDTDLAYASTDTATGTNPDVVAAAYTNSVQGAAGTTLYAIDAGRDFLVSIGSVQGAGTTVSPNTGQLFSVGTVGLGVDVVSGGLDIANNGPALALINAQGGTGSQLYAINTTSGAATLIGTVGDGSATFADIAVGNTVFTVSPATQTVAENAANATITVNRSGVATGPATVTFTGGAPASGDAATAGTDFGTAGVTTFTGTVTFADGDTSETITVPIISDTTDENDESFLVTISAPSAGSLGASVASTVVITDDDNAPTPSSATVATDPVRTTGKATQVLTVRGTDGDDVILVAPSGSTVVVTLNGQPLGQPTPSKGLYRVVVYGGAGNDEIRLNSKLKFAGELHGEDGDDLVVGGKNRDLIVGGDGVDGLFGRGQEDIVIGGISDYTADPVATATLLNVFLGKGSFATRAEAVSVAGVNSFVFSSATIDNDNDRDYLSGDGTADLILTNAGDGVADESNKGIVRAI